MDKSQITHIRKGGEFQRKGKDNEHMKTKSGLTGMMFVNDNDGSSKGEENLRFWKRIVGRLPTTLSEKYNVSPGLHQYTG